MAADDLAAILSGTAAPEQVEAFHQAAAASDALRLEAQSALAFVDAIEQAPLAAPALLVQQALVAERAPPRVAAASPPKPSIWAQLLPRRQVAAACVMLLMAGGLTWSLIGREAEAPHEPASPVPATVPAAVPAAVPADNRELDTIVRSKAPASEMAPLVAPRSAPAAAGALPPPVVSPTPLPEAALPPKPLADPCAPGFANVVAPGEAGSPAASQVARSPTPAAGSQMKTAAVPAGEPGCPPGEGRAVLGTTTPEAPETVEGPRNQKSDKARANRAASRKAAVDRPAHPAPRASVQSPPERAR